MYRVPDPQTTQFTVRLPQGIRPRLIMSGYDAARADSYVSFSLLLDLDWRNDAPRVKKALLWPMMPRLVLTVPVENVRLAAGGPLSNPDVWDAWLSSLICAVTFAEVKE